MLAPHHGKNAELGEVRVASKDFFYPLKFFGRKAMLFDQLSCNYWIGMRYFALHSRSILLNSRRPLKSLKSQYFESPQSQAAEEINAQEASA
jgi:hypothetical protein